MIKTTKFKHNSSDVGSNDYLSYTDLEYDYSDFRYPNEPARTGTLWGWGYDGNGQMRNGLVNVLSPQNFGGNWKYINGGSYHIAGILSTGALYTWGYNNYGQLGLGDSGNGTGVNSRSAAVQVGSLTNWKQTAGGYEFTAAIKTDGTLWTWGRNQSGQLGHGNVTYRSSPVQVGSLTDWKYVECLHEAVIALKTNGTLWVWGRNTYGELGDGTNVSKSSPIQVGSSTDWKYICADDNSTVYVIKTDGTLWGWGANGYGQLGDGTIVGKSSPIQIGTGSTWKSVIGTAGAANAIKTDGTLWGWGYNADGRSGTNTSAQKSSPVQIGTATNWRKLTAGVAVGYGLKTDGTLYSWGYNNVGQIGNGTSGTNVFTPVQIGSLTNWQSMYRCGYSAYSIK